MSSVEVSAVCFPTARGLRLYGILHRPAGERLAQGIIICNPGIKSRVGPHQLYIAMARRFSELGFNVLRFDPEGFGDSEGAVTERSMADVLGSIEYGRLVESACSAMDWMERECGNSRFVLSGLCGGAITGLLAAKRDRRVQALLALGIPVISTSAGVDPLKFMTDGQLDSMREAYVQKIFSLKPWVRFLTLQTDYRALWKSLVKPIRARLDARAPHGESESAVAELLQAGQSNLNRHFAPAFFGMVSSGRPAILIFSSADRLYWEWKEKFAKYYARQIAAYADSLEIHVAKDANHIFSFRESREEMLSVACNWLVRHCRG